MTDLVSRLLEAIAAKEAKARVVGEERLRWEFGEFSESVTVENANDYVACGPYGGGIDADDGRFIADNDPSSVLRRCAADRKLIERDGPFCDCGDYGPPTNPHTGQSIPHHYDCSAYEAAQILAEAYGLEMTE